jgi:hypothetical protein
MSALSRPDFTEPSHHNTPFYATLHTEGVREKPVADESLKSQTQHLLDAKYSEEESRWKIFRTRAIALCAAAAIAVVLCGVA